jgi:uncharacterized protein (UPF0332 family)
MAEPLYRQLLSQARRLSKFDPKRPQQGNLRRGVSTAYYALFHCLVDLACRCIIGTANERRPYRDVLARSFQHRSMVGACHSFAGGSLPRKIADRLPTGFMVPTDIRNVAQIFCEAQEKRHLADYDTAQTFTRSDVLALIRDVEQAMALLSAAKDRAETRFFFGCLLTWGSLVERR